MQFRPHSPRPVDVTMRDGAPAFVGTPPQAVLDVAGPWRTDETWWSDGRASDDYDVLLEDGALVASRASRAPPPGGLRPERMMKARYLSPL